VAEVDIERVNSLNSALLPASSNGQGTAALWRALFEAAPEALLVVGDSGVVVVASDRAVALLGGGRAWLIGRAIDSIIVGPLDQLASQTMKAWCADGREIALEVRRSAVDIGGAQLLALSLRPVNSSEGVEIAGATSTRFTDEARPAARLGSEFVANMSHVLRTPLNSIIGFAKLMHHGKVGPISDRHREYLGDILNSAHHLLSLINDVLDLSKVDAGVMEFRPQPIDLPQLLGEVREIVAAMAASKQISIAVAVDPSCTGIQLDPAKLKQVVYNFLSNALKFTERGRIDLRATTLNTTHWRLEIEDTGRGMRADEVARLFAETDGRQLGMALTRRIVEAQGGWVGVTSVPGRGSRFFATFPRIIAPEAAEVAVGRASGEGRC
jgi:PAS domain S-box-containing protein